ncbi:piggyBac transposable element-derived protein 4-like [Neoarius graeffei]|uniref:piggyBac transposable element-derived protein 4-like n=1 Tax=Neoarius graeffei TaxID=443677 RepID=UPI00298C0A19|nr:piggyBac transposable element-derived protein 4-like [Neoarius graeffei]
METCTREGVLETLYNSDDETSSEEYSNEDSFDASEEEALEDVENPAGETSAIASCPSSNSASEASLGASVRSSLPAACSSSNLLGPLGLSPSTRQKRSRSSGRPSPTKNPSKRSALAPQEDRWHDDSEEDVCPPQFPFCPKRNPGAQLDLHKSYSPLNIFQLYFSHNVLKTLCTNTNKNAARKYAEGLKIKRPWTDVTPDEMLNYFSLILYLGLVKVSSARDLWKRDDLYRFPFPASIMPGDRYEAITAFLHMSDPAGDVVNDKLRGQPGFDGLFRLKPLLDDILMACRTYYHPHQNLAVDERMVATKARIRMKEYMKYKTTKWGYKLFVLADSQSGYTCDFSIYEGKAQCLSDSRLSFDVVVNLLKVPRLGTGYHVFVDNFYTSTALFNHLHQLRFGACGTVRENSVGFPRTKENALTKKSARGEMRWIRESPLLYVKWKDTCEVMMCSTIHKANSSDFVRRRVRNPDGTWTKKSFPVPEPVKEYNKYMGGVDLSDALIKYFSVDHKTSRWYMKLFLHFIDIAVVNSFIIYKEMAEVKKQKPLSQKKFRMVLCRQLAKVGKEQPSTSMEPPVKATTVSLAPKKEGKLFACYPAPVCEVSSDRSVRATKGRRKCVQCKLCTIYKCEACDVALCIIPDRMCFTQWHKDKYVRSCKSNRSESEKSENRKSEKTEKRKSENCNSETSEERDNRNSETSEERDTRNSETSEERDNRNSETSEERDSRNSETSEERDSRNSETSEERDSHNSETSEQDCRNSEMPEGTDNHNSETSVKIKSELSEEIKSELLEEIKSEISEEIKSEILEKLISEKAEILEMQIKEESRND